MKLYSLIVPLLFDIVAMANSNTSVPSNSSIVEVAGILFANPGKAQRIIDISQEFADYVKKNEPGTLGYAINLGTDAANNSYVVVAQTYKNQEAFEAHTSSSQYAYFSGLIAQEKLVSQVVQEFQVGGFAVGQK